MRLNVLPLMDAIEAYIRKADDDLEQTLADEGYTAPAEAVAAVSRIEDSIAESYNRNTENLLKRIGESAGIENFVTDVWPEIQSEAALRDELHEAFRREFISLLETFTTSWMIDEAPDLAGDNRVTKPAIRFIEDWSEELAGLMQLSNDDTIGGILSDAVAEHRSVQDVSLAISDSGIRAAGYKSRRAAITEVLRIESYSQLEYMRQDPAVEKKEWLHTWADHPRENHVAISGQTVPVDEPFVLVGKDGVTYRPMCPRDTCLPASESVNCHCLMKSVRDKSILGMSAEERSAMREKYMNEVDAEWAAEHASDKVNDILSMEKKDQIRYFGGKKDGQARLALIQSGVINTDEKLLNMYKKDKNGKLSLKSLQELADDGIFTVSDGWLKHSAVGDYIRASEQYPTGRMVSGGHGQAAMSMCDEKGIEYSVTKTFSNGVRLGNVPSSRMVLKRTGNGQAWFPESWDEEKIRLAGTAIANDGNPLTEGYFKTGVYDGVAVRILITNGNVGTVCPDIDQSDFVKGVK